MPPGFVDTEGLQESPVDVEGYALLTPMKRLGRPENIAAAVAFLASDDADYITGHTLSMNGGHHFELEGRMPHAWQRQAEAELRGASNRIVR